MADRSDASVLLEMRGIIVAFGGVHVLDEAYLRVRRGEVHALLGENGAGKSSLVKALFGLYACEAGEIVWRGETVRIRHPSEALERGIAMIHQELPFAEHLSVAQNLFLGREYRRGLLGFIDEKRQHAETDALLEPFPIEVDPRRRMGTLSVAQQQIVAIAKALSTGADLIILDEATTALTGHEAERLFEILSDLKAQGKTFIMITHKLDEVFEAADRVTVMRDGRTVAELDVEGAEAADLVRPMVGREVRALFPERTPAPGPQRLRVEGLSTGEKLRDISFEAHRGEVLGLAGLMGAGRTSLLEALFGVIPVSGGQVFIDGTPVTIGSPGEAIRHGFAFVTEDRKGSGLAMHLDIEDNVTLARVRDHTRFGLVDDQALHTLSDRYVRKLHIHGKASNTVRTLSGGNQQKVVLAKWLATGADVFLMDEPTRGIDVGAKREVYVLINELTRAGKTVLLVTSELPELMAMSDRFLVLAEGRLVRTLTKEEATPEHIVYHASKKPDTLSA